MMIKIKSNTIRIFAVVFFVLFNSAGAESSKGDNTNEFKPVDPNRIPQILSMISSKVRKNYEKIKTWEGETVVKTERTCKDAEAERIFKTYTDKTGKTPKALKKFQKYINKFSIDTEKDFLYVNRYREKPSEYTDLETGRNLGTKSKSWYETSIITPENYLYSRPHMLHKGEVVKNVAVKEKEIDSTCNSILVFDPRRNFLGIMPIWETFSLVLQYIDKYGEWNVDGYALKVEEHANGNTVKYRIQQPGIIGPGNYLFVTRTFTSEKDFNMTLEETTNQDGKLLVRITRDYELIDNVHLPSKVLERHFGEDGKITHEKVSIFKKSKINRSIPAETFTYKNLGLKDGDKFVDKTLNKEFTYQKGNLIAIEKKSK